MADLNNTETTQASGNHADKLLKVALEKVPYSKLDTKKMFEDILAIVETDWASDMSCKQLPDSKPYTQAEALEMAEAIGNIYLIAHRVHCWACHGRYLKANTKVTDLELKAKSERRVNSKPQSNEEAID